MSVVITGKIADRYGHAHQRHVELRADGRGVTVTHERFAVPAAEYRHEQSRHIPLDLDHGDEIVGSVVALERDSDGLWVTAVADDNWLADVDKPMYLSASIMHRHDRDVRLDAVALTHRPASIGATPVQIVPGTLAVAAATTSGDLGARLVRARDYSRRRYGQPHEIIERAGHTEVRHVPPARQPTVTPSPMMRPMAPLEHSAPLGYVLSIR